MKNSFVRYFFICVLALLFLQTNSLHAQSDADSLKSAVSNETDYRTRAEIFYELAEIYYYTDLDSSLHYAKQYLKDSKNAKDTFWIADAYNYIAYVYDEQGEIKLALEYFQKALENFIILEDQYFIAACYNNLGYMTSYGKDQAKGLTYFLESMEISESIKDSGLIADVSTNIGYYYDRVDDNTTAFRYYQKALEYSLALGDTVPLALSYLNMAGINIKLKNFDDAKEQMLKSKKLLSNSFGDYHLANYYTSIIDCYIEWEQIDSAQIYIDKAEEIMSENKFAILNAYLFQSKGNLAYLKKEYQNCIKYLDETITLFKNTNTIEPLSRIYAKKAAAYSSLKMYDKAYITLQRANSLNDSLGYGILANMLGEFEQKRIHKIETEKTNLETELSFQMKENTEIKLQSELRTALFSILFLVCIILIIFYFLWRIRKKNTALRSSNSLINEQKGLAEQNLKKLETNEHKLKQLNTTKDKLFSIIGHDLKAPLGSLAGFTKMLIEDKSLRESDKLIHILESMNKTSNFGFTLLGNLLEWARSQTGNIVPKPEKILLIKTLDDIVSDFKAIAENKHIKIDFKIEPSIEVIADKNMLTTVLRNLIHNAIKYSYKNGIVEITSFKKDKFLITSVKDDGVGIPKSELSDLFSLDKHIQNVGTDNEQGTGLGLILCKEFVRKNKGEIWAESTEEKGSKFSFSLPLYIKNKADNIQWEAIPEI